MVASDRSIVSMFPERSVRETEMGDEKRWVKKTRNGRGIHLSIEPIGSGDAIRTVWVRRPRDDSCDAKIFVLVTGAILLIR
jgi:hypothetical protein